jgi:TonB-linked SusC/RagA family outer membrane protein
MRADFYRLRSYGSTLLWTTLIAAAITGPVGAQQTGVINGTVRDAGTLAPVSGAQVVVAGRGLGVLTGAQGEFTLPAVPAGAVEVRVELLGYETLAQTATVVAGQTVTLNFALSVTPLSLDEMIVTVTGLQRRREIGNATTTVDVAAEAERGIPPTLLGLLQGRVAGLQVLQSSGSVGATPSITIRGNSSFLLDDTPIIYLDGTRVSNELGSGPPVGGQTTSRLADLNLEDIESIEIVNGPSAATLYGTEAAAGVIRITTKKGRAGQSEWTFHTELGGNWDASEWPVAVWNPRSFFGEVLDLANLVSIPPGQVVVEIPDTLYTLDLLGEGAGDEFGNPWRTGMERSHGASVRGGAGNVSYFLSGDVVDRLGNLDNNEVSRRGIRANVSLTPSAAIGVELSTAFSTNHASLPENDDSAFGYIGVGLLGSPWLAPIQRDDLANGAETTTCPAAVELQRALIEVIDVSLEELAEECGENPFYAGRTFEDVATLENEQGVDRFTGSVNVDARPLSFLQLRGTLGYDRFSERTSQLVPVDPELPFSDLSLGYRTILNRFQSSLTASATLNVELQPTESIRSVTSVGAQYLGQDFEAALSVGRSLPPGISTVSSAVRTEGSEALSESRILGVFAQQQFGYRDRFFLTPAIRVDESSTFGEDQTRAVYPRLQASWVARDGGLVTGSPFLTSLLLRAAWGVSGKQPAPFAAIQQLGSRAVRFQGRDVSGVVLEAAGNADLKPERGEEIEVGFDATAWDARVDLSFTWFRQVTRDGLIERVIAPSSGYVLGQIDNLGEVVNSGLEVVAGAIAVDRPGLRSEFRLNLQVLDSEITELDEPIVFGYGDNSQRHQQGYAFASYFAPTYTIENGEPVASDSAVFVGQPTPTFAGSLAAMLDYSDWLQLSAVVGFAGGHQLFNATEQFQCGYFGGGEYGGICSSIYETDADGGRTDEAKIKAAAARDLSFAPWIEDADFARLRSVSARFMLPTAVAGFLRADRGSFTVLAENLALFTTYSGLDPEVNFAGGASTTRAEFFTLPLARRLTGRVVLTF